MLAYLSSFDVVLWFVIAAAQIAISVILRWRNVERRYPAFCLFIYFSALKTLALISIKPSTGWTYFWAYYACSVVACVLMAVAVGEIYVKTFGPKISLPDWVPHNVATWLAMAISSCAIIALSLRPLGRNKYMAFMSGTQATLVSALLISLIIAVFYSRYLGITWRPWMARIAAGFILFLSFNSITLYILGLTAKESAEMARRMGQVSYLAALAWWGITLWAKEPVPERATLQQTTEMLSIHEQTMETALHAFSNKIQ